MARLLSIFSMVLGKQNVAQNTEIFKGRFELGQRSGNFESSLHVFLSGFGVHGFEIGRVSVFEKPLGAEIEFKETGSTSPFNTFVMNLRRTPFSNREQFNFSVRCLKPMEEAAAQEIAKDLETALLECPHTKNVARGVKVL